MAFSYRKIRNLWMQHASKYWWGDPLDVRFFLCKELSFEYKKSILDIGCNTGIILNCADNTNKKQGFDLDKEAIALANKIKKVQKSNATYTVKDVFKAKLKKESFDIIVFANMIEMFDNKKELINKISIFLKPGGTLYITTPNAENRFYKGRGKVSAEELQELLDDTYEATVQFWNPFNVHFGQILRFAPRVISFLGWLMRKDFASKKSVALYAKAIKR